MDPGGNAGRPVRSRPDPLGASTVNLFGRARKARGGGGSSTSAEPQYYRVACPEGHSLRGQRTEGYQALRCPACGEGVFILPRSPLPEPPAPATAPKRRRRPVQPVAEGPIELTDAPAQVEVGEAPVEVEIDWEDDVPAPRPPTPRPAEPPADPPEPRPAARKGVTAAAARDRPAGPTSRPAAARAEPPRVALPSRPPLRQRLYRRRHALLVMGVLALVVGAVGYRLVQQRLEDLPEVAATNREEGARALEEASFDLARQKLNDAASALERLRDPDAPEVRQMADEAAVFASMASRSLEQIIEEVATRSDGPAQFESLYKGRTVVIDAHMESPGELDYRIVGGGKFGRIDLEGFSLLDGKRRGDPVTFGAALGSIRLDDRGEWRFQLKPDSGVWITSPSAWKALQRLGWPSPDAPGETDAPKAAEGGPPA